MKPSEITDTDDCSSDFLHVAGYYARALQPGRRRAGHAAGCDFEERSLPDTPQRAAGPPLTDPRALNPRARRELILLLVLIACGLFVVPLLIWTVGEAVLGPYAGGSPFALLMDFFVGLKDGSPVYWSVVVGPYVFVLLLRLFWYYIRRPGA